MKRVLVPIADGFEEIETMTIVDVLRRAEVQVTLAGIKEGAITGSRNVQVVPDQLLDNVNASEFDAVIVPGGQPGVDNLRSDSRVLDILKNMKSEEKLVGAICAAPLALRDAGLISGASITSYPGVEGELGESNYQTEAIVQDGNLITSRGPGTAMQFSLALVELLVSKEKKAELAEALLVEVS